MAENNSKDEDIFDDADFEDLDPIEDEDDLSDENWGEDAVSAEGGEETAEEVRPLKKTFVQKNFSLIVIAVVVVFGGVIGLSLMGGGSTSTPGEMVETPETDGTLTEDVAMAEKPEGADMPPMPAPINAGEENALDSPPEEAQTTPLTPMPESPDSQKNELDELTVEEIPATPPAGKITPPGEAPFDFDKASDDIPAASTENSLVPPPVPADNPIPDLTPQLEAQKAENASLQTRLSEQEQKATKSLAQKDQEIAVLEQSVKDLKEKLAEAEKENKTLASAAESSSANSSQNFTEETPKANEAPTGTANAPQQKPAGKKPAVIKVITDWGLKSAQPGKALLVSKSTGDTRNVVVGDNIEGLGRIMSIANENGHWTVRGNQGTVNR